MPVVSKSNNRFLPANSHAVPQAKQAMRDLVDVQQRRYANAIAIQGYPCVVYHMLEAGEKCSCNARGSALAARLDEEGKLDSGKINELISGGLEFRVNAYASKAAPTEAHRQENNLPKSLEPNSLWDNLKSINQIQAPLGHAARDISDPAGTVFDADGDIEDVNGPVASAEMLAKLESAFDDDTFGLTDVSCTVCMGTGFVGAASVLGGWRRVFSAVSPALSCDGVVDTLTKPVRMIEATSVSINIVLPRGAVSVDSLTVWDRTTPVPAVFMLDGVPVARTYEVIAKCDGAAHVLQVVFATKSSFTHVEFQMSLTTTPTLFEFPKLNLGSDTSRLDPTEDVQLNASPDLPIIRRKDVVVDMVYGKAFRVHSVSPWNDANRNVLGWDISARVIQPNELLHLLPRRSSKQQPNTVQVRGNQSR